MLDPVNRQFEVIFGNHQDLVAVCSAARLTDHGAELGDVDLS